MKRMIAFGIILLLVVVFLPVASQAQAGRCGDFDGDGDRSTGDYELLADYLYEEGAAPDSLHLMNVDGYPGVTVNDLSYLWVCLFIFCGELDCDAGLTYQPDTAAVAYIRNRPVPAGETEHEVGLWIQPSSSFNALAFPFVYTCATSPVTLDSISWSSTLPSEEIGRSARLIDSTAQTGLAAFHMFFHDLTEKYQVATLHFSVTSQPFEQEIMIDTTVWQGQPLMASAAGIPSLPALYGTPTTPASPPSCCEGMTGDVNLDGNVTLGDLTLLVNFLFTTFEPLPCPAEGNTFGDDKCYLNLTDITLLMQRLFVTFKPTDYCDQFDNFICGQFY